MQPLEQQFGVLQVAGFFDHVLVGDQIAVRRDGEARAGAMWFISLRTVGMDAMDSAHDQANAARQAGFVGGAVDQPGRPGLWSDGGDVLALGGDLRVQEPARRRGDEQRHAREGPRPEPAAPRTGGRQLRNRTGRQRGDRQPFFHAILPDQGGVANPPAAPQARQSDGVDRPLLRPVVLGIEPTRLGRGRHGLGGRLGPRTGEQLVNRAGLHPELPVFRDLMKACQLAAIAQELQLLQVVGAADPSPRAHVVGLVFHGAGTSPYLDRTEKTSRPSTSASPADAWIVAVPRSALPIKCQDDGCSGSPGTMT